MVVGGFLGALVVETLLVVVETTLVRDSEDSGSRYSATSFLRQDRQCYSCMNLEYRRHWNQLQQFYYRQKNFTEVYCTTMAMVSQ